ncbi:MAG TPA: hypothetical protein VGF98_14350 [Candidatus Tumulicola sp.]|jgi:hypothetical protein
MAGRNYIPSALISIAVLAMAACGGSREVPPVLGSSGEMHGMRKPSPTAGASAVLYVLKDIMYKGILIVAYDANDPSRRPKPIYTIAPGYANDYSSLVTDARGDLYVGGGYEYGSSLYVFPAGAKKPVTTCALNAGTLYSANNTLYVVPPDGSDSIVEYREPLPAGNDCGSPLKTLTDTIAVEKKASKIGGIVVDSEGDVFDLYSTFSFYPPVHIDEFKAGSNTARHFDTLKVPMTQNYLAADRNDDIVSNVTSDSAVDDNLAVFPHESKKPQLYDPTAYYRWGGLALNKKQTELIAAQYGSTSKILFFAFDSKSGTIGQQERTFGDVQPGGRGTIALYEK